MSSHSDVPTLATGSDIDILFDYDRPLGLELVSLGDFLEEKLQFKVDLLSKKAVRDRKSVV